MKILKVTENINDILYKVCDPVINFDDDLYKIIDEMASLLLKSGTHAIALAAPQVGINQRIFVSIFDGLKAYVNPYYIVPVKRKMIGTEGCLSLNKSYLITRYTRIHFKCDILYIPFDKSNIQKQYSKDYYDFNARVIQHEIDHLNGILIGKE